MKIIKKEEYVFFRSKYTGQCFYGEFPHKYAHAYDVIHQETYNDYYTKLGMMDMIIN
jgi:hypothetical protein